MMRVVSSLQYLQLSVQTDRNSNNSCEQLARYDSSCNCGAGIYCTELGMVLFALERLGCYIQNVSCGARGLDANFVAGLRRLIWTAHLITNGLQLGFHDYIGG